MLPAPVTDTPAAPVAPPPPPSPRSIEADLRQARHLARRLMRLQQRHPLYLRRQNRANALLVAEWVALIAGTYLLVYGPLPWPWKAVLLVPWSIYSSLALDVAI